MKHILILASLLTLVVACKKEEKGLPCFSGLNEADCELIGKRFYPQFDVSNNPEAWVTATIEGFPYSIGSGREVEGYQYDPVQYTTFSTNGPQTTVGGGEISGARQLIRFDFTPIFKPTPLIGKVPGLISIWSPYFQYDTITNKLAFMEELLKPGRKSLDFGFNATFGWNFNLTYYDINQTDINNKTTSGRLYFLGMANTIPEHGYFEITELQQEDLGTVVRFTFWAKFDIDFYRRTLSPVGEYVTSALNGNAKLYVDIPK